MLREAVDTEGDDEYDINEVKGSIKRRGGRVLASPGATRRSQAAMQRLWSDQPGPGQDWHEEVSGSQSSASSTVEQTSG